MKKNVFIVIFIITTIIASCVAVYFKVNGDNEIKVKEAKLNESIAAQDSDSSTEKEAKVVEKTVKEYKFNPELDSSKCINPQSDEKYQLRISYEFTALPCVVNSDNKSAVLTTDWSYATNVWGFATKGGTGTYEQKQVNNFSNEIINVISTGWGQTSDYSTLLFLMKDGTVEYIPIRQAYKTNNFNSYGKLAGVSDIVYIGNATGYGPCTPIAMKADGTFYQLSTILTNTGNYNF